MPVAEIIGVTKDPERGVTAKSGLYEFFTEAGGHVYLHDMSFTRLTYQPGRPPVLELQFVYHPGWTPPELSATPVVTFGFEDVRVVEWREDLEGHGCVAANPDAPPGQVDYFDWDGTDLFTLDSFTLHLAFQASRLVVATRS
ncbi:hypothetical protein AB0L05_15510 [Nonomuraea pusilla]|uniref:hypothetical protein n=1 Tax=Nonomuraea pusilla TaxID=46177 RepID=UPI00331962B6